jgi:hypothetical protein
MRGRMSSLNQPEYLLRIPAPENLQAIGRRPGEPPVMNELFDPMVSPSSEKVSGAKTDPVDECKILAQVLREILHPGNGDLHGFGAPDAVTGTFLCFLIGSVQHLLERLSVMPIEKVLLYLFCPSVLRFKDE